MQMYCCSLVSMIQSKGVPDYQYTVDLLIWVCLQLHKALIIFTVSVCLPVCPSFHMSTCISTAPTWWISVKFVIGVFYEHLCRKFEIGKCWAKIMDTLYEALNTVYCFWQH